MWKNETCVYHLFLTKIIDNDLGSTKRTNFSTGLIPFLILFSENLRTWDLRLRSLISHEIETSIFIHMR